VDVARGGDVVTRPELPEDRLFEEATDHLLHAILDVNRLEQGVSFEPDATASEIADRLRGLRADLESAARRLSDAERAWQRSVSPYGPDGLPRE
jgi:hypothetical protein